MIQPECIDDTLIQNSITACSNTVCMIEMLSRKRLSARFPLLQSGDSFVDTVGLLPIARRLTSARPVRRACSCAWSAAAQPAAWKLGGPRGKDPVRLLRRWGGEIIMDQVNAITTGRIERRQLWPPRGGPIPGPHLFC